MKIQNILFYFLILVVVALSIYLLWFVNTEGYQCMNNPLQYGASKLRYTDTITNTVKNVTCSCDTDSGNLLLFNSDEIAWIK